VTLPPTETLVIVTGTSRAAEAAAGAVACVAVGLLALLPAIRRRGRR